MTRRGAHARGQPHDSEERLRSMGSHVPPPRADVLESLAHERAGRVMRVLPIAVALLLLVVVVVAAGIQWFRPLPAPVFRSAVPAGLQTPGSPPVLPWPTIGAAALSLDGAAMLGHVGGAHPVPVAGLAKVMTAEVVLVDHPLTAGSDGPSVPVTPAAIAAYQAEQADRQSTVPSRQGRR